LTGGTTQAIFISETRDIRSITDHNLMENEMEQEYTDEERDYYEDMDRRLLEGQE